MEGGCTEQMNGNAARLRIASGAPLRFRLNCACCGKDGAPTVWHVICGECDKGATTSERKQLSKWINKLSALAPRMQTTDPYEQEFPRHEQMTTPAQKWWTGQQSKHSNLLCETMPTETHQESKRASEYHKRCTEAVDVLSAGAPIDGRTARKKVIDVAQQQIQAEITLTADRTQLRIAETLASDGNENTDPQGEANRTKIKEATEKVRGSNQAVKQAKRESSQMKEVYEEWAHSTEIHPFHEDEKWARCAALLSGEMPLTTTLPQTNPTITVADAEANSDTQKQDPATTLRKKQIEYHCSIGNLLADIFSRWELKSRANEICNTYAQSLSSIGTQEVLNPTGPVERNGRSTERSMNMERLQEEALQRTEQDKLNRKTKKQTPGDLRLGLLAMHRMQQPGGRDWTTARAAAKKPAAWPEDREWSMQMPTKTDTSQAATEHAENTLRQTRNVEKHKDMTQMEWDRSDPPNLEEAHRLEKQARTEAAKNHHAARAMAQEAQNELRNGTANNDEWGTNPPYQLEGLQKPALHAQRRNRGERRWEAAQCQIHQQNTPS